MAVTFHTLKKRIMTLPDPNTCPDSNRVIAGAMGEGGPFYFTRDFPINVESQKHRPAVWIFDGEVDMSGVLDKCSKCENPGSWLFFSSSIHDQKWPKCQHFVACKNKDCQALHEIK